MALELASRSVIFHEKLAENDQIFDRWPSRCSGLLSRPLLLSWRPAAKILKNPDFRIFLKLPKIVPWVFRITQHIRTDPETSAAAPCALLRDLQRPVVMGARTLADAYVTGVPSTVILQ